MEMNDLSLYTDCWIQIGTAFGQTDVHEVTECDCRASAGW